MIVKHITTSTYTNLLLDFWSLFVHVHIRAAICRGQYFRLIIPSLGIRLSALAITTQRKLYLHVLLANSVKYGELDQLIV